MSPQQREEISALFDTIDQFAIGQQNILDMTFQERAIDFELPERFVMISATLKPTRVLRLVPCRNVPRLGCVLGCTEHENR